MLPPLLGVPKEVQRPFSCEGTWTEPPLREAVGLGIPEGLWLMAGMLILCAFLLPAAVVVSPLSIAEHLPASPPAAVSGLQRAFREKEARL